MPFLFLVNSRPFSKRPTCLPQTPHFCFLLAQKWLYLGQLPWPRDGQQSGPHALGPWGTMCITAAPTPTPCSPGMLTMIIHVREKQAAILFKPLHFGDLFVPATASGPQYRPTYPSYLSPVAAFHLLSAPATLLPLTSALPPPSLCLGCFYKMRERPLISHVNL